MLFIEALLIMGLSPLSTKPRIETKTLLNNVNAIVRSKSFIH